MHTMRARSAAALTGAAAITLLAGHAAGQVQVNDGQTLSEADLLAGLFNGQAFTLDADAVIDINSGGVIGPVGDATDDRIFDFNDSTVNINSGGRFASQNFFAGVPVSSVSNIRLNLFDGGKIDGRFDANAGAVVNIFGGDVGGFFRARKGSEVHIHGGEIAGPFVADSGSKVSMSGGGVAHRFDAFHSDVDISGGVVSGDVRSVGGRVTMTGGSIRDEFTSFNGGEFFFSGGSIGMALLARDSRVSLSGGTFGRLHVNKGGSLHITGGEFRKNGHALDGFTGGLESGDVVTGTLADGSVFILSADAGDSIATTAVSRTIVSLPPPDTTPMFVSSGAAPRAGLRQGQELTVSGDGRVPNNFAAVSAKLTLEEDARIGDRLEIADSELRLAGGRVGRDAIAFGSDVLISGGDISWGFKAYNSDIEMTNGSLGAFFNAHSESNIIMRGGVLPLFGRIDTGSALTMFDGSIGNEFTVTSGSTANIFGGIVSTGMGVHHSDVNLDGGSIGRFFHMDSESELSIFGGEFMIDGRSVDPASVEHVQGLFTGTLADGSVFIFNSEADDDLSPGRTTLNPVALSPADTAPIIVSEGSAPINGLRAGQSLTITGDATLRPQFGVVSAALTIEGGAVGFGLETAFSVVDISGGVVGGNFNAHDSVINISGGEIGDAFGVFGSSIVNLFVTEASLDGDPLDLAIGDTLTIDDPTGAFLEATLADGAQFDFILSDARPDFHADFFSSSATLTITLVPSPGAAGLFGLTGLIALRRDRRSRFARTAHDRFQPARSSTGA